jgi:hypothetical protein
MNEKTGAIVRRYYGWFAAALTIVCGALFIWQVLALYISGTAPDYTGESIFTRERVMSALGIISPVFWIWIVSIVAGFILWEIFPASKKVKPLKDDVYTLKNLKKRIPQKVSNDLHDSVLFIDKQEKLLLIIKFVCALVCIGCAIYGIVYLATPSHFPKVEVTHEMLNMVKHIMPFVLVAFVCMCGVTIYEIQSSKKQLKEVKKLIAYKSKGGEEEQVTLASTECPVNGVKAKIKKVTNNKYFVLGLRIAIGCLGVAFVIAGIFNENMHGILVKAINICTECIGLG